MFGEGKGVVQNCAVIAQFLFGRLFGYLIFGVIAWGINRSILQAVGYREFIIGLAYVVLSVFLICYTFFRVRTSCVVQKLTGIVRRMKNTIPLFLPLFLGFFTGLSFCPPFLLALTSAADKGGLAQSILFFFMFFLGTSVFFIPAPFVGLLRSFSVMSTIGKLAAGLVGIYYLYSGIIMLVVGIKKI